MTQPSENFKRIASEKNDDLEFHSWFNGAKSMNESISSGFTDFTHKIFSPDFYQTLGDPSNKTALEIGYGGGRLLLPASFYFQNVIGVDIHDQADRVSQHLKNHSRENFSLFHVDQINNEWEGIEDQSIDFVYSFIVFQHFDNWSIAENYFKFLQRVMKPEAQAIIYFGNNTMNSQDVHIENPKTFVDFPMILHVKPEFVKNELVKKGFRPYETGVTTKRPWSKPNELSRQFFMKFSKV